MFKNKIYPVLLIFIFYFYGLTQSDAITPQSIVVNPKASFEVEVWIDKDPSGNAMPQYNLGEPIHIYVRVSEASYVYLFSIHSDNAVDQILPNRLGGANNYLQAGETRKFPPQGATYSFTVSEPEGIDKVIAVASKEPLDVSTLAQFDSAAAFASAQHSNESFAQSLSIVVSPVEEQSWVTDTIHFAIGEVHITSTLQENREPTTSARPSTTDNSNVSSHPQMPSNTATVAPTPPIETANSNSPNDPSAAQIANEAITIVPTNPSEDPSSTNSNNPTNTPPQVPDNTITTPANLSTPNTPSTPQISDETITIAPAPSTENPTTDNDNPSNTTTPNNTITIAPVESEPSSTNSNSSSNPSIPQPPNNNTITISPIDSSLSTASVPPEEPATNSPPPNSIVIAPLSITPRSAESEEPAEQVIFQPLSLKFCAGKGIRKQQQNPKGARITFSSDVSLEEIHACYHQQIIDEGWQFLAVEQEGNKTLLAYYSFQDKLLDFNLNKLNKNQNYRLKLSLE